MRKRGRVGLMAAALVGLLASGAIADVTTEQSASILVFPKVIADGTRDTIIQITNTSNSMVHAHCFYVNGGLTFPLGLDGIPDSGDEFPSTFNPPLWVEIDFDIWLTKQQPTYWLVSEGRLVNPDDAACSDDLEDDDEDDNSDGLECPNAGFDPGRVPPVVESFTGELKCIEVDASGAPLSGNHLKGEATIIVVDPCDIPEGEETGTCRSNDIIPCEDNDDCPNTTQDAAKYNAIGVIGLETNNSDGVLCLGGDPDEAGGCPNGAEYNACPETWILNHYADDAEDIFLRELAEGNQTVNGGGLGVDEDDVNLSGSEVHTTITVVPCSQNFETQVPETAKIQFLIINEFEQPFSASTSVVCWDELELEGINPVFSRDFVGSNFLQTRLRPSTGVDNGFMVVACETHTTIDGVEAAAAVNVHVEGERASGDVIVIPAEQLTP